MIIGLSGKMRSGKSTLGAALEKELGFKQLAFADGVREFIAAAFGWPLEYVQADAFKNNPVLETGVDSSSGASRPYLGALRRGILGRELLQRVGNDAAKSIFGEDCWVNVGMAKATGRGVGGPCGHCGKAMEHHRLGVCATGTISVYAPTANYVFTDVRFPNELRAIQAAGGKVLRLNTLESWATFHAYAKAEEVYEEDGMCRYRGQEPDGTLRDCSLPPAVHPCGFPTDRHASETSLPAGSNVNVHYDAVYIGSLEANTAAGLATVKGWLSK